MGYKNKTNKEYQDEYYSKNKVRRNQYYKDYYKANHEYIRIYQYFYHRYKKYEHERDLKKVYLIPNKIIISILED
jgi:hypothetical protein